MHGRRHPAVGTADQLPFEYRLANLNERIRHAADALVQRHVQARRQRRLANRLLHRRRLVGLRFDAALEAEEVPEHCGQFRRRA
ncbi:MAG: hypothetical protein AW09_002570 [Candidatus Accumulibacter phosphatis]|uniref:Uncharacterized protein n=1 Tax=Candidatus Accumulibacter phosphatis TaxID=327160 RepID=A0A080LWN8_9PROT|nr:MAG: hypothetical protein AW09_002570 [Candidatus Accumulibacter phosphatis]